MWAAVIGSVLVWLAGVHCDSRAGFLWLIGHVSQGRPIAGRAMLVEITGLFLVDTVLYTNM